MSELVRDAKQLVGFDEVEHRADGGFCPTRTAPTTSRRAISSKSNVGETSGLPYGEFDYIRVFVGTSADVPNGLYDTTRGGAQDVLADIL